MIETAPIRQMSKRELQVSEEAERCKREQANAAILLNFKFDCVKSVLEFLESAREAAVAYGRDPDEFEGEIMAAVNAAVVTEGHTCRGDEIKLPAKPKRVRKTRDQREQDIVPAGMPTTATDEKIDEDN